MRSADDLRIEPEAGEYELLAQGHADAHEDDGGDSRGAEVQNVVEDRGPEAREGPGEGDRQAEHVADPEHAEGRVVLLRELLVILDMRSREVEEEFAEEEEDEGGDEIGNDAEHRGEGGNESGHDGLLAFVATEICSHRSLRIKPAAGEGKVSAGRVVTSLALCEASSRGPCAATRPPLSSPAISPRVRQVLLGALRRGRAEEDDEAGGRLEGEEAQALRPGAEEDQGLRGFVDVGVEEEDAGLELDGLLLRDIGEEGGEPREGLAVGLEVAAEELAYRVVDRCLLHLGPDPAGGEGALEEVAALAAAGADPAAASASTPSGR